VGVCVYIRAHTHTLNVLYSDVSPGVETRNLENPKNLDGLNLGIYVFVHVYKVQFFPYLLGDMILLAFITVNSSLKPLLEGPLAQLLIVLSSRAFGRNRTGICG